MAITKDLKTSKSTQETQNLGFDTEFNLPTVENLVYNPTSSGVDRMVQPATDDSIMLLRQIRTILYNHGNADVAKRQVVSINLPGAAVTTTLPVSGTVTATANINQVGGIDPRFQVLDISHVRYATGIRNNLSFT